MSSILIHSPVPDKLNLSFFHAAVGPAVKMSFRVFVHDDIVPSQPVWKPVVVQYEVVPRERVATHRPNTLAQFCP